MHLFFMDIILGILDHKVYVTIILGTLDWGSGSILKLKH